MDFQVLMFTSSGLLVRFLKVFEKSGYQSVKWVRYMTKAGSYQIRVSHKVVKSLMDVLINFYSFNIQLPIPPTFNLFQHIILITHPSNKIVQYQVYLLNIKSVVTYIVTLKTRMDIVLIREGL